YRVAIRVVGNAAEAEDVAAEALSRAFARWDKVESLSYLDAWVLRVAANLAIDVTRRRRPWLHRPVLTGADDDIATRMALTAALQRLSRRQREVIVLRHLAGLPEQEIAALLGIAHGSVKTHLRRGAAALRDRLGEDFRTGEALAGD